MADTPVPVRPDGLRRMRIYLRKEMIEVYDVWVNSDTYEKGVFWHQYHNDHPTPLRVEDVNERIVKTEAMCPHPPHDQRHTGANGTYVTCTACGESWAD